MPKGPIIISPGLDYNTIRPEIEVEVVGDQRQRKDGLRELEIK